MAILRSDIERALSELVSQEAGMLFQGLAVQLGKEHCPELIANQRKKDFGLEAYAPASRTSEKIGKGLAASITATWRKISGDAKTAKENHPDLETLYFVTPAKIGNADRRNWEQAIHESLGLNLHIIEREEIITLLMMPKNASLCASFLRLDIHHEPQVTDLIARTKRAATVVTESWAGKIKGQPLIDLTAVRLVPNGTESTDVLSLEQVGRVLSQRGRIVLEGPAGCGKTTTLIQLAQRERDGVTPFMIDLPAWTSSRRGLLEHIAGMAEFQAEGLTALDLARVQQAEPCVLLLNGWNEIAESDSAPALHALRELDRGFPSAGIIIATRTHHLTPLPGAVRLRLRPLKRTQRSAYLATRLGKNSTELCTRIEAEESLDELTRTPFILSEVAALFEAGARIPSTKIGILAQVVHLQEQREEHLNAFQEAPIFGRQADYLKALATEMTRRGAVGLPEADARAIVAEVAQVLANRGQIQQPAPPSLLASLTAHHVLERVDYPTIAFRFDHQQLQEYFATLDLRARLLDLRDADGDPTSRFTAAYVNQPAWAEPLRMIAATFDERSDDASADNGNVNAGARLVKMALDVDLVFTGELARLCGAGVWDDVRSVVGDRFRAVYAMRGNHFRDYAVAAMLATGMDDFSDLIAPLLSEQDEQVWFRTVRLWPDIRVSSLGPNWREVVRGWSDAAQSVFVAELLRQRIDTEVVAFAIEDDSIAVKMGAVEGLMWHRSDDALSRVLASLDAQTFEDVAREDAHRMPKAFRSRAIATLRRSLDTSESQTARLRTALRLVEFGETDLDGVIQEALAALPDRDVRDSRWGYLQSALKHLCDTDPAWASEWVAIKVAEGVLVDHEQWMPFATAIPDHVVEEYLTRLEADNLECRPLEGMIAVVAAEADAKLAERVFAGLRRMFRKVYAEPDQPHEVERQVIRQMEALFRGIPDDVAVAGVISAVTDDASDIKVAARLLSRVGMAGKEGLHVTDGDLKAHLRAYLKRSIAVVLRQDDLAGEEKAHLASAIAQVGEPEDMSDLVTLIRADIERMRRGRAARMAGERGPRVDGASASYANWNVAALIRLDPVGSDQVLMELLPEPEYARVAAEAMARHFLPERERPLHTNFRHDLVWAAREGSTSPPDEDQRRTRFATALRLEIARLREQREDPRSADNLKQLAQALAAVDGRGSAAPVLDVIAMPDKWGEHTRLEAAERLLTAGVVLPLATVSALANSFLQRTQEWMHDTDRYLLRRIIALFPLTDDVEGGIERVREVLGKRPLKGYELRDVVSALGESRSDAATDLLRDLPSDERTFEQLEVAFVQAIATLDTPGARELLLGFVDPDICGIVLTDRFQGENALVERLAALAQRSPEVAVRLQNLCDRDLPERNRRVLSRIMASVGTPDALAANLQLIDDANPSPVPRGVWDQLESAFVERRPLAYNPNAFTLHARASNELRARLFAMALQDPRRRKSAFMLLGRIERWRLGHGRPTGEPRHPDIVSGQSWPPTQRPNR
ncbi:MAG: NACHT domain-containing protein [Bacteroidetes bacterium SB0662_bin_6]|nr:NACHT domain-containing protein [Bacteroidetes bacterium SB0662_bin_6]